MIQRFIYHYAKVLLSGLIALFMNSCEEIPDSVSKSRYHFVGDSLVVRWSLTASFPMLITYNHGFSGSGLAYMQENAGIAEGGTAVVLSGTNDLYELNTDKVIDTYAEAFIDAALNLGGERTYIISLLPRYFINESYELSIELTNRAIRLNNALKDKILAADQQGKDTDKIIEFVDVFPYLTGPSDQIINWQYYNDGLHLNKEGYSLVTYYLNRNILN